MRHEPQTACPGPYHLAPKYLAGQRLERNGAPGTEALRPRTNPAPPCGMRMSPPSAGPPGRWTPAAAASPSSSELQHHGHLGPGQFAVGQGAVRQHPLPVRQPQGLHTLPCVPPTAKWPSMETHLVLETLTDGLQISLVNSQSPPARGCRPAGWRPRCSERQGK